MMTESRFTAAELRRVMAYGKCHEEVSRKGHAQPCDKPAVAVRLDPDALPTSHHDGEPKDFQHWHGCKPVRIGGGDE